MTVDDFFNSDGANREQMEAKRGSGTVAIEGWYHFDIGSVEPDMNEWRQDGKRNKRNVLFKMIVMHSAKDQSPVGRIYYHRMPLEKVQQESVLPLSEAQVEQNLMFLERLGVMEWREINGQQKLVDTVTNSTKVTMDTFLRCKGRHCMAQVKFVPKNGDYPERWEIPYQRIYRLTDESVAKYEKSMEMFKLADNYMSDGSAAPQKQDGFAGVASNF